ncbi:MAG: hypothetical protein IKS01_01540 [Paludibacteraceae bacterium]|nr:hypothetical protein [Paludibacteraceae bacterium]
MKRITLFLLLAVGLMACEKSEKKNTALEVNPTSITCNSGDETPITVADGAAFTITTADSCVAQPLADGTGVRGFMVGQTVVTVTSNGKSAQIPVTVAPKITEFQDPALLFGGTMQDVKDVLGEPKQTANNNLYYNVTEDGSIYAAYKFENGKLTRIYVYLTDEKIGSFYKYLNERYFIEVVDEQTAHYYNHFNLNFASLKVHLGHDGIGWFAEYRAFDPAHPYD